MPDNVSTFPGQAQPAATVLPPAAVDDPRVRHAAVSVANHADEIPTFTAVAAGVDHVMSRIPWWVVMGGSVAITLWLTRRATKS